MIWSHMDSVWFWESDVYLFGLAHVWPGWSQNPARNFFLLGSLIHVSYVGLPPLSSCVLLSWILVFLLICFEGRRVYKEGLSGEQGLIHLMTGVSCKYCWKFVPSTDLWSLLIREGRNHILHRINHSSLLRILASKPGLTSTIPFVTLAQRALSETKQTNIS